MNFFSEISQNIVKSHFRVIATGSKFSGRRLGHLFALFLLCSKLALFIQLRKLSLNARARSLQLQGISL
jgi:hypothetical protein